MTEPDLTALREAIEALDRRLLTLLAERMELSDAIAAAKLAAASPFRDPLREDEVLKRIRHAAAGLGLDPHESRVRYVSGGRAGAGRERYLTAGVFAPP